MLLLDLKDRGLSDHFLGVYDEVCTGCREFAAGYRVDRPGDHLHGRVPFFHGKDGGEVGVRIAGHHESDLECRESDEQFG